MALTTANGLSEKLEALECVDELEAIVVVTDYIVMNRRLGTASGQ
jgi:hypothetical protein